MATKTWTPGTVIDSAWLQDANDFVYKTGYIRENLAGGSTDQADLRIRRRATYSGGTPGFVNAGLFVDTFVESSIGSGVSTAASYEWAIVGVVHNYSSEGQNVGGYFQGLKYGLGPTWGATIEVKEMGGASDPTTGTVALEVDVRANGTDANSTRVGLDLVLGKHISGGTTPTAAYGFRLQAAEAGNTFVRGFSTFNAICDIGFDTSEGTINQAAFRMAEGQVIAFNAGVTRKLYHNGNSFLFTDGSNNELWGLNDNFSLTANGVQLLGTRRTGWGIPTGTATRTTFNTGTVTLEQLAERVKALIDDHTLHGLIGA